MALGRALFKTRSQARDAIDGGKVQIDGVRAKPSREALIGQELTITLSHAQVGIRIKAISDQRASGVLAQALYEESSESIAQREKLREMNFLNRSTAPSSKPDTRDRQTLRRLRGKD